MDLQKPRKQMRKIFHGPEQTNGKARMNLFARPFNQYQNILGRTSNP
jgi:hypothetical protein